MNRVALSQEGRAMGSGAIKLEVGTLEQCQSQDQFFASVLEEHFEDFKIRPCEQVGMETYFVAAYKIPILNTAKDWPQKSNSLVAITAGRSTQVGGVDVDLLLNQERFRRINKAIEAKYFQKFDFSRSRITIQLENDQLTYHDVLASNVFANGLPVVELKAFGLKPGAHLDVELSDVQREFFSLYSHVPLFKLILSI
ncbi:MAG: hypothetical protein F3745_04320 [Nitrospinae bacterium]|nr:hypothetical protein [Nitrospinota bacterium]